MKANPPTCDKCDAGAEVKSGQYLRNASAAWASLDDAAKQAFQTVADMKRLKQSMEDCAEESVESGDDIDFLVGESETDTVSDWGIGDRHGPLSAANMTRPFFDEDMNTEVTNWRKKMGTVVQHDRELC